MTLGILASAGLALALRLLAGVPVGRGVLIGSWLLAAFGALLRHDFGLGQFAFVDSAEVLQLGNFGLGNDRGLVGATLVFIGMA